MSARSYFYLAIVLLLIGVGAVASLFWVQNSVRTTQLSLDLMVAAWQLQQPVQIPALLAATFGGGFVLGAGLLGLRSMGQGRRIRRLEQEITLGSGEAHGSDWK